MSVPRETIAADPARPETIRQFCGARFEVSAIECAELLQIRVPVTARNSTVKPGKWAGLEIESGRVRKGGTELRARCVFESGAVRAVSVLPAIAVGDLYWVASGKGPTRNRSLSRYTLEVDAVSVARLQDMGDLDAVACGACHLPPRFQTDGAHREWFGRYWESRHGRGSWHANPWVWVLEVGVIRGNVDDLSSANA